MEDFFAALPPMRLPPGMPPGWPARAADTAGETGDGAGGGAGGGGGGDDAGEEAATGTGAMGADWATTAAGMAASAAADDTVSGRKRTRSKRANWSTRQARAADERRERAGASDAG